MAHNIIIKIGHQDQANKPIYLLANGVIQCGRFEYRGRFKKKFKTEYTRIIDISYDHPKDGILDVSEYRYWDAISIYEDYVLTRFLTSISASRIEKFAAESAIVKLLDCVKEEFIRAVGLKWSRIFKRSDPLNPDTPKKAWQIL